MPKIRFTISADGSRVSAEGIDFHGSSCLKEAEKYIGALGRQTSQDLKPEFYEPELVSDPLTTVNN